MKTYEADYSAKQLAKEIAHYKILSADEERECFRSYAKSRNQAKREAIMVRILQSNLKFVLKLANDWHGCTGLPVSDLYAEGKLGLIMAFNKYNYRRGIKFGSFAVWEINRHMSRMVENSDLVRVPAVTRKRTLNAMKGKDNKCGDVDDVRKSRAICALAVPSSLDAPVEGREGNCKMSLGAILPDDRYAAANLECNATTENVSVILRDAMTYSLDDAERKIIREIFGMDGYEYTAGEIATNCRSSKDIILARKQAALKKLRDNALLRQAATNR